MQDLKRFGYDWLTRSSANHKYKEKINIYVVIYYVDINTKELKESPFTLLSKEYLETVNFGNRAFTDSLNQFLMRDIFPHTIMNTFYYTDNRTVIPKQFQKQELITDNQLTFNF